MNHVVLSLFWTLAGLVVGYYLGRAGRLDRHREAVMVHHAADTPPPAPTWWRRHLVGSRLFGVVLVVLAVLSVLVGASYIERVAHLAECVNAYQRANSAAVVAQREASAKEREGQRRILDESFRPRDQRDPVALRAAYEQYVALLAAADAQRTANPLPVQAC
jgi:hypothetical protein